MTTHDHAPHDLTRNQSLVLETLSKSPAPMSAYNLLDSLRESGIKAPLQVYRALDKLVEHGLVHRLESLSAFVACQHPDCQGHAATVFMICEKCGHVTERSDTTIGRNLQALAQHEEFTLRHSSIELRGNCSKC